MRTELVKSTSRTGSGVGWGIEMRTVESLIEELKKFPGGAYCFGYSGEMGGVIIRKDITGWRQIGTIDCGETDDDESNIPAEIDVPPAVL